MEFSGSQEKAEAGGVYAPLQTFLPSPSLPSLQGLAKAGLAQGLCVAGNNASLFWHRRSGLLPCSGCLCGKRTWGMWSRPVSSHCSPACPRHSPLHHTELGEGNKIRAFFPLQMDHKICLPPHTPPPKRSQAEDTCGS